MKIRKMIFDNQEFNVFTDAELEKYINEEIYMRELEKEVDKINNDFSANTFDADTFHAMKEEKYAI